MSEIEFDSMEEAEEVLKKKEGYMIEVRKGEPTKCQRFCDVAKFCTQYQDEIKAIGEESVSK